MLFLEIIIIIIVVNKDTDKYTHAENKKCGALQVKSFVKHFILALCLLSLSKAAQRCNTNGRTLNENHRNHTQDNGK